MRKYVSCRTIVRRLHKGHELGAALLGIRFKILCVLVLFSVFMAGVMLTACGNKESAENTEQISEEESEKKREDSDADKKEAGGSAPAENVFGTFTAKTLDGTEITQDIFKEADLTMVNIWGTFCGPCIREMPDLGEISREYEGRGFQIVGILCDVYEAGDETALEIVEVTQADYTHIVASPDLANGILRQVQAVPMTIFVDSDGNQAGETYTGSRDKESWMKIIEEVRADE